MTVERPALRHAVIALATLWLVAPAVSAPRLCDDLKARLSELPSAGSGDTGRFDAAIGRQKEQMAITRGQARDAGCGFALIGPNVRRCAALNATLDRMADNLDQLQRQRSRIGGGGGERERGKLMAAIDRNGCAGPNLRTPAEAMASQRLASAEPALADDLSRMLTAVPTQDDPRDMLDDAQSEPGMRLNDTFDPSPSEDQAGLYRTMCVRTCDGYYFPMSQAVAAGDFERDQKNCETACPGTQMQLFYGQPGSLAPGTMISSVTGRPYSEMPAAFEHQKISAPPDKNCSCHPVKDFSVQAGAGAGTLNFEPRAVSEPVSVQSSPSIMVFGAPEENLGPRQTHFQEHERDATLKTLSAQRNPNRKIRVVGPAFLPAPEASAGLKAQGRAEAR